MLESDRQQPDINLAYFQNLLLERRRALLSSIDEGALAERESAEATEGPRDTQDAGDNSVYEVAEDERLGGAQRATHRVRMIDAALSRIADGTYGICRDCDKPIDRRRLVSVPEAQRCANCQEMQDQRSGNGHHATL